MITLVLWLLGFHLAAYIVGAVEVILYLLFRRQVNAWLDAQIERFAKRDS